MKTILAITIWLGASALVAQAQTPGDYKHPYGLTQSSKSKVSAAKTQRTKLTLIKRNYKNPQTEKPEAIVTLPSNGVQSVNNPLTATDNYKRQNRIQEVGPNSLRQDTDIIVQDSTEKNRIRRKD